jgi:DNA-binding MarR family transcriptional regulator
METPIRTEDLSLQDEIVVALRRITRAIDLRSRTLLQDYGLTVPQLATLQAIGRLQPITASAIAKHVHLGQPTVTGILNRLEKRRLIRRIRGDQDRRSINVSLTPEGEGVLSDAPSLLQHQFQQELSKLKEWERTQILSTLQRIADMMDATEITAAPVLSSELADVTAGEPALHLEESPHQVADELTTVVTRGLPVSLKSRETTNSLGANKVRG